MTTPLLRPAATVTVDGIAVEISGGNVSLDAGRVPYAIAEIEIPLVDPSDIEAMDPRDEIRAVVTGVDEQAGTSRVFNLGLRSRDVDHRAKTISVELASDEALLMDYAPLEPDYGAFDHQDSLRGIIDYVLAVFGAELEPGLDDVPVPVNYVRNPAARVDTAYWVGGTNSSGPTRIGSGGPDGESYVYFAQSTAGDWRASQLMDTTVAAGDVLRFEFDLRTHRDVDLALEVLVDGVWYSSDLIQKRGHGWSNHRGTITVTAGSNLTQLQWYAPGAASGAWDIANARLIQDDNNSAPELLTWDAGVTAWEFLSPLTSAAGLRLFCDEQRKWRLIDPAAYSLPGVVSVAGWNATEGVDRIDREDPNVYCTGVVVRYRWRDASGAERRAVDTAGVPGRVLVWPEFDRPYPGPGAAAAILARRAGTGRLQQVTALTDWTATPSSEASVTLPATDEQIGQLQSVDWSFTDGLMRLGTRGLTEAAFDSWLGWSSVEWEDEDADLEWEDA